MKLFVHTYIHSWKGVHEKLQEATLSHIRAAAKEMGYALVPVEPTDDMRMDGWVALDDVEGTHKDPAYYCWKAMIKAAEEE